jgi:hypothetical protein
MVVERIDFYAGMIISGLCGGVGSALGAYLVNRGIIKHVERLEERMKKKDNNQKQLHKFAKL